MTCEVDVAAIYSDSQVSNAWMPCFVEVHAIGLRFNRCSCPVMDLRSDFCPAKSASEYDTSSGLGSRDL